MFKSKQQRGVKQQYRLPACKCAFVTTIPESFALNILHLIAGKINKSSLVPKQTATTIKDIARQLKMSPSTVSRALRGSRDINAATRLLVQQVAEDLHYTPNPIALSLKEKRSKIVGVIVPEIANNFCSATIAGIEDYAYRKGYHVMIFQSHEAYDREVANVRLLTSRRIDGLIISLANNTREFSHLEDMDAPIVMFDRVHEGMADSHKVVVDDYAGAFRGVEHLVLEGCRNIAILSMAPWLSITQKRLEGYRDALQQHGIPIREEHIVQSCETEDVIRRLFEGPHPPDALFFSMERLAIMCLKVLKELGLRIPEDVALAGFSDSPVSTFLSPALTTIRQPTFEIGLRSAELLIARIENPENTPSSETVQLDTWLDIQASSLKSGRGI